MHWMIVSTAVSLAAILGATAVSAREDTGKSFSLTLEGAAEAPGPGDPDGTGTATIRINPGREQLCFNLSVSDIAPATAAHVHEAPVGEPGPVTVGLAPPTGGTSNGCVTIDREEALEIIRNPEDYYVNVHNAEYPAGALRAQLGR